MEGEEKTKEYNDQENGETQEENSKKVISLDNADFSKKSQILNSPRSLEACLRIGVEPFELYKLSVEEFKNKYPDVKRLSKDLFDLRYNAEEEFRNNTIKEVKEERKKIIEEENKKKEENKNKENQSTQKDKDDTDKVWDKIIENEKKSIEKIKKKQRQNIQNMIEDQINKELMIKVTEVKDQLKKEREEEAKLRLEEKRKQEEIERRKKEEQKQKEQIGRAHV